MRLIFLLFDSLNRLALSPYGGDIETPNFQRLADRGVSFDCHYVGSLPCIPARRDIQTGRVNFFHRSWGPMEPFDRSFCASLREKGVYTHLITDHFHYFEPGGTHYHSQYDSWDFIRGQEYDPWKAMVAPPLARFAAAYDSRHYDSRKKPRRLHHLVNRAFERSEADMPLPRCFASAFEFLDANRGADDWMLQLELFDPHEPFHAQARFRRPGDSDWTGGVLDWPDYKRVDESPAEIAEIRANYAALVRMCDEYLGRLLDYLDAHAMWDDTALVLSTDHGFMLGEHDWWGKGRMPYYEEIVHVPLLVAHPALPGGRRSAALTQTIDLMPTILDCFGCEIPAEVRGASVLAKATAQAPDGRVVAFGYFAGPVGVTDGRQVMLHYPGDVLAPGLHEYTLMPQHMGSAFSIKELQTARHSPAFDFTRGMPLLQVDALSDARRPPNLNGTFEDQGFRLYDLEADPRQLSPIRDAAVEARLYEGMVAFMRAHDAPSESYDWLGLSPHEDSRAAWALPASLKESLK